MRPELEDAIKQAQYSIFSIGAKAVRTNAEWEVFYAKIMEDCAKVVTKWVCEDAEKEN